MGGRAGSGARMGVGINNTPTIGELKLAQKAVSTAKAQYTKAKKRYTGALGYFYHTAQSQWSKQEAKTELNKAYQAYESTKKKYYDAKAILDAKSSAYMKGSNSTDNTAPLF